MRPAPDQPTSIYVTYNGLLDPLGETQGLRYVESLARSRVMHVISFERPERLSARQLLLEMRGRVARQGIGWSVLRYHRKPQLIAKAWDVLRGSVEISGVRRGRRIGVVHARGHVPMDMAMRGAGRAPILFDIRGLLGEEYIAAGLWGTRDISYRLLKRSERNAFRRANAAVVLTHASLGYVQERFAAVGRTVPIRVIPTCVDTDLFRRDESERARFRAELGADDATVVFAYSGSLGNWYMANEMAAFVRCARDRMGAAVRLLWLVNNTPEVAQAASRAAGLASGEWRIATGTPNEVPKRLSAADVGLALIRPSPSHLGTAPTKYAEYLAMGIPIILSESVGDSRELVRRGAAVPVRAIVDQTALASTVDALVPLLRRPAGFFRALALEMFDVERVAAPAYRELYSILEERAAHA